MKNKHIIQVNYEKCIGCAMCQKDCPAFNIEIKNKKAFIKSQACIMCGHCVAVCPKNAISISGFEEKPLEIEKTVILNDEELLQALKMRRSVRQFKNKEIEKEVIEKIIEAGRFTPTGSNAQDISYIVLKDNLLVAEKIAVKFLKRLIPVAKMFSQVAKKAIIDDHFFFKDAPIAILVLSKDELNAGLAASNMELMAQAQGLGVLYSGFFALVAKYSLKLRKLLKIKKKKVVTVLVLGYPNVKYHRTVQKEKANISYY